LTLGFPSAQSRLDPGKSSVDFDYFLGKLRGDLGIIGDF
jgi:hypothetical protein